MPYFRNAALCGILLVSLAMLGCGGSHFAPVNASSPAPSNPPGGGGTGPAPTVFDNIQQLSGWLTCGSCGNTGGSGATATYSMTQGITSPSESGSSAEFSIGGSYAYSNAYWYYRHPAPSAAMSSLVYQFDLYLPSASGSAPQAIEFECQQQLNGYIYNFAWQADYASNSWRVFNYTAKKWEDAGIPLQRFATDTWHHIVAEYHNDGSAHVTYHDALTIDGARYPVSISHQATPTGSSGGDFTNAFQLDLNGTPVPYSAYVDKMRVETSN